MWRKSRYSQDAEGCVELARLAPGRVGVRDSKNIALPHLSFTTEAARALANRVKSGDFDR